MTLRTGIILAAGFGSRLSGAEGKTLKPLTEVSGVPLIQRVVAGLEKAGCGKIVVVLGHGKADLVAGLGDYTGGAEIVFAFNPRYDLKNGVSVLAARPHLHNATFVIAMADHIVDDDVMELARAWQPEPGTAALLVDYKLATIFDMDDATKVLSKNGRIENIGKTIADYNCVDCGIFVCSMALMDAIASVYDRTGDASLSEGVQALASKGNMYVVDIGDGFWQDVDTPEMLAHAEAELLKRAR